MERERQPLNDLDENRQIEPHPETDEMTQDVSRSVDVQRTTAAYSDAMAIGRRILKERRAVLAALAK